MMPSQPELPPPLTAVHVAGWKLERLAEELPQIWRHLASLTVHHMEMALFYAASFASADMELRVLATLSRLIAPTAAPDCSVHLPIGQADIAELTGLSRNTVSRVLARLAEKGCLERRYGSISVDVARLRELIAVA